MQIFGKRSLEMNTSGSGRGALDLESRVKFQYFQESRNFFEPFHESRG